jgi:hypothetical protein
MDPTLTAEAPPAPPPPPLAVLLPRVAGAVRAVGKDQRNAQQGYQFRGIDDLLNAAHGPLAAHGVSILPRVTAHTLTERPRTGGGVLTVAVVTLECTFVGPAGDTLTVVTVGEAHDTADKATNKAMSAAMKYALILTFTVPTADLDDADRTTVDRPAWPTAAESLARIDAAAARIGRDRDAVTRLWRARNPGFSGDWEAVPPADLAVLATAVDRAARATAAGGAA